jgi:hypothetical protein
MANGAGDQSFGDTIKGQERCRVVVTTQRWKMVQDIDVALLSRAKSADRC